MLKNIVVIASLIVPAYGCGHESAAKQQIRTDAAVDLSCTEPEIEFIEEEPTRIRVEGCGQQMTYMYRCKIVSTQGGAYGERTTLEGVQQCRWAAVSR